MSKRLLIVGTGGFATEVAYIARRIDPGGATWNPISYVAPTRSEVGNALLFGSADFCDDDVLSGNVTADVVIGVGDPQARQRVASRYANAQNLVFPNLIDPSVDLDCALVTIGIGNIVHRNVVMTFNIATGDFNLFNKCLIGHNVKLGSFNTINPSAQVLSNCRLGDACLIGAGATVLPKVSVADRSALGAGALLRHDITEPGQVFVGIPAKKLR